MKIKTILEGCKHGRYYCSTDKKWKCRQGPKQSRTNEEFGEFRKNPSEEAVMDKDTLMDMKEQTVPDWEMLDHRILTAKYFAENHRHAVEFVDFINRVSEYLDHFAEVVQDVAEVTIKTTTSDTNSLTILDFALAKAVDEYAKKHNIQQERIQGNFESKEK